MEYWALQCVKSVAVIASKSLREKIKETLNGGISEYFNWGLGIRVCEKQGDCQPLPDGSFGWSGAYGAHFWVEPTMGRSAVLMLNKADIGGSGSPFSYEFEKLVMQL